jgi:hypothetical protein
MDIQFVREQLHKYIDRADEQSLSAVYALVENNIITNDDKELDEATMNEIYKRRENHRTGASKSFTIEESFEMARAAKKSVK